MASSITGVTWQEPTLKRQRNFTEGCLLLGRKALRLELEPHLTNPKEGVVNACVSAKNTYFRSQNNIFPKA